MIEAVIFDLDGTLIDLPLNYDKLIEEFGKIAPETDFHPLVPAIAKLNEEKRKRIFEVWDRAELALVKGVQLTETGRILCEEFTAKPKALVTLQGRAFVDSILAPLGLSFNYAATRENSLNRATQLELVARQLGRSHMSILFIGNTPNDRQAAKQVGCQYREAGT